MIAAYRFPEGLQAFIQNNPPRSSRETLLAGLFKSDSQFTSLILWLIHEFHYAGPDRGGSADNAQVPLCSERVSRLV